jgi:hypothetical protein
MPDLPDVVKNVDDMVMLTYLSFMHTLVLHKNNAMRAGPMYVKYNAVLRGLVTGGNRYTATIYLVCSGLRKLSRMTKLPEGLMVYRGNGGMALPLDFLEPDAQVYSLFIL